MYTYRVLNNLDYDNLEANGKIIAKKSFSSNNTILEALKTVGGHIQNGSKNDYPWISTSTSFTTVVEHYAVPYNGIKQRPLVAKINVSK